MKKLTQHPHNTNKTTTASEESFAKVEMELTVFAETQAHQNGSEKKPTSVGEFMILFVNIIVFKIQKAIDENQRVFLPISGLAKVFQLQQEAKQKITPLHAEKSEKEHEVKLIQEKKKQFIPDVKKRRIRICVFVAAILIAIAEGCYAFDAFRISGFAYLTAIASGIGIAAAIAFSIHLFAQFIGGVKRNIAKWGYCTVFLIVIYIGISLLGSVRASGINNENDMNATLADSGATSSNISSISLTLISFALFLVALLFSIYYAKTDEEKQTEKQYDDLCREEAICLRSIAESEAKITYIKNDLTIQSAIALDNYEEALANENKLQSLAYTVTAIYIKINMRYRDDIPAFFVNPPIMPFRTFFNTNKKDIQ